MLRVLVSSRNTSSSGGGGSRRNHARRIFGGAGTTPFHHMNGGPQQQTLRHVVLLRRYISSSDGSSSIRRRNGIVERIDRIPYHFRHLSTKYYSCTSTVKKTSSSNGAEGILRWDSFQQTHGTKLESLPEVIAMNRLDTFLHDKVLQEQNRRQQQQRQQPHDPPPAPTKNYKYTMNTNQIQLCLDSSIMTFLLHVYARQASLIGHGYYTIGPCGEELLSSVALALHSNDSLALHYRHLAVSISRQLLKQDATSDDSNNENTPTTTYDEQTVKDILLARARGYTISKYDPVTGGVHCALGGGRNDYIVTSTLASQCPPAVGRALAYSLNTNNRNPNQRPISMCTVGDGSVHNGHFWSAWTLAKHAKHMNIKCPLVMGISDNGLSISYQTKGFVHELFPNNNNNNSNNINSGIPIFRANGQDMMDVYDQTTQATNFARKYSSPTLLLFSNMIRRFGHAATDRQISYLDQATIDSLADTDVLQSTMIQAIEVYNVYEGEGGYVKLRDRYHQLQEWTKEAFEIAMNEPKVTLDDMMERVTMPLIPLPSTSISSSSRSNTTTDYEHVTTMNTVTNSSLMVRDVEDEKTSNDATVAQDEKPQVLRKQMTRVLDEIMSNDPSVVYLGEDVIHGGYYLVTEGLATKFNKDVRRRRIFDFPPDETSLLGAGLGFRQVGGVVPIVELPYAKYLDCGVDMFYEIAILNWLSNRNNKLLQQSSDDENSSSTIQPHGMVIRLQGFDRGIFGGNFHTHNMLSHIPPGVDVVCYSNGFDYVQGMRHAMYQAKHAGRIIVCVDCTHLLNLRHLHAVGDRQWECQYPETNTYLDFDTVRRYHHVVSKDTTDGGLGTQSEEDSPSSRLAIVSYGNGVVTALQARKALADQGFVKCESDIDIIDCPYLSGVPKGLEEILPSYDGIVFADICKEGPGSNVFSSMIMQLQEKGLLPSSSDSWIFVGAPRTYNPLGSTVTFLSKERIESAVQRLLGNKRDQEVS